MSKPQYRHIAGPGTQKAGEWVPCSARTRCRNGGVHTTKENLQKARDKYLQVTGANITVLGRVPLKVVQDMLGAEAVMPNNLFREQMSEKEKIEVFAKLKEEANQKALKPRKIVKHFNHESSFIEILETVYNQNEYEVSYPITRVVRFDRNPEGKQHFKEARAFIDKQKWLKQPNGASARFFPNIDERKQVIHISLENKTALIKWTTIEAHYLLSINSIGSKEEDNRFINKFKRNRKSEYEEFLQLKDNYIKRLKAFGIEELIDFD